MIKKTALILFVSIFLIGCFSNEKNQKTSKIIQLGEVDINYYSDKSVSSLEVPPDLTSPAYENSFRLSEFISNYDENLVNLTDKSIENTHQKIIDSSDEIQIKRFGDRRWLVVNKTPELAWNLSSQFLKDKGFVIKKSNKKIGVMETDYRENQKPEIPSNSIGDFRAFLAKTIENVNYTLPTVDKYRIRIEPINEGKKSEVYLSLQSMAEVSTGPDQTMWQISEKDQSLENEMLYSLMVFLGSDSATAREKIINAKDEKNLSVSVQDGLNGFAKLVFQLNMKETWDNVSWAISDLDIEIEDKDIKAKTFYISTARTSDKGIMTRLFGDEAVKKNYQLRLKSVNENITELLFNDISELNEEETKNFSYDLFSQIKNLF